MKTNTKLLENTQRYRRTQKGVLTNMYRHMVYRNKVDFSLQDFQKRFLSDKKFNRLFNEWIKNKFQKQFKPSLDRINKKEHYTLKNTQMLTWAENRYKQTMERRTRKGSVLQFIGNKLIKKFISQRQAVMHTGISQGNMSAVLNGKRQTAGGYYWKFENPELLEGMK